MRFDHAILAVYDLEAAARDFEALGFNTVYGGKHAGGQTHNRLIPFLDGSYLELLAPIDPNDLNSPVEAPGSFLHLFKGGEGFAGYALHSEDLEADLRSMQERGLLVGEPQSGSRSRPDGQLLEWRMATIPETMSPFFLSDTTPRELRVPGNPEQVTHPNGAVGVAGVAVAVGHIRSAVARYQAILGTSREGDPAVMAGRSASFALGPTLITLASPKDRTSPAGQRLARRGEGPYRLRLYTTDMQSLGTLDPARTHGGLFELVPEG